MGDEIQRRLAAVLAADVAGYSRLMQVDAEGTVLSLDQCRQIFSESVDAAGGRVVDMAGDSVLAVFDLATTAVEAAVAIQKGLTERNAPIDEARRMCFRVGIHLGEVLHKHDGTVYGDGVNIAARLESLSEPGGVCVSAAVHDVVSGQLEVSFADAGEHQVKNIARPVRAWRVIDGSAGPGAPAGAVPVPVEDRPSIAVLPFDNMSGDVEQSYFSDGITEDVITDLSKVPGLFVIARNSSFVYKGKAQNLKQVAAELGVRYVLEGSVRKAKSRVRITTQLIDGKTGGHVWAERYDRELEDIFAVQDEVTATIVEQLSLRIAPGKAAASKKSERNLKAWDLFLRGREAAWRLNPAATRMAIPILKEVIALDPEFAAAHAVLGVARVHQYTNSWGPDAATGLRDALAFSQKALELDPNEPTAHFARAIALQFDGKHEEAIEAAKRGLAIDPNNALMYGVRGSSVLSLGRAEEALTYFDVGMRLDPLYPSVFLQLSAHAHYMLGDYEKCRELVVRRISLQIESDSSPFLLAACLGHLGDAEGAKEAWRNVFIVNPEFSVQERRARAFYRDKKHFDAIVDGIRMAGIDTDVPPRS